MKFEANGRSRSAGPARSSNLTGRPTQYPSRRSGLHRLPRLYEHLFVEYAESVRLCSNFYTNLLVIGNEAEIFVFSVNASSILLECFVFV